MMEFMALGNHRKSILGEIADATNRVRKVQLDALVAYWSEHGKTVRIRLPPRCSS